MFQTFFFFLSFRSFNMCFESRFKAFSSKQSCITKMGKKKTCFYLLFNIVTDSCTIPVDDSNCDSFSFSMHQ